MADIERAASFYDATLGALGYVRVWSDLRPGEQDQAVGYGEAGGGDKLALKQVSSAVAMAMPGFHIAFSAPSRHAVIGFHSAALAAGAADNGKPGLREHYGPSYFATFVIDPEGHHLEAVCKSSGIRDEDPHPESASPQKNVPRTSWRLLEPVPQALKRIVDFLLGNRHIELDVHVVVK